MLMLLLLSATINSHAVVVDNFTCQLEATENETGESVKQSFELSSPRFPILPQVPEPGVLMTKAYTGLGFEMKNAKREINVHASLSYEHAVKMDYTGQTNQIIEARQNMCITLSANYCKKSTAPTPPSPPPGDYEPIIIECMSSINSCFYTSDPFHPVHGWPVVGHSDGVADFDAAKLNPITSIITEHSNGNSIVRGTARLACQYKGTYK